MERPKKSLSLWTIVLIQCFLLSVCWILTQSNSTSYAAAVITMSGYQEDVSSLSDQEKAKMEDSVQKNLELAVQDPDSFSKKFVGILQESPGWLLGLPVFGAIMYLLPAYFLLAVFLKQPHASLGEPIGLSSILRGISIAVTAFLIVALSSVIIKIFGFEPKNSVFQTMLLKGMKGNTHLLVWSLYTIGLFTGIVEEFFFRGFLLKQFIGSGFVREGLIFTSALFGIVHYDGEVSFLIPVLLTFVGYMFGYAYWKTGNIWVSVTAHSTYNMIGLVVAFFLGDQII